MASAHPTPVAAGSARSVFRSFPLEDALLWFHPASGTHVRIAAKATRGLRRVAPRVVMFGITNACNLTCGFCSRDVARASRWTVATATAALQGLAAAGTLEVAFGGGEPFLFPGFAELVGELHATTPLALHATTNATWLTADRWRPFAGRFGQVQVSLHDDPRWRRGAQALADAGQRWGANQIVDDAQLVRLPAQLAELARLGCHAVSLLNYLGPDQDRHLGPAGHAELAAILAGAPLPCRLSVCFGGRVPAPRLFDGMEGRGDCGAGRDFVSITPDQQVQACSFQDHGLPGATAAAILAAWQQGHATLAQPASRAGCARQDRAERSRDRAAVPPIAVWQAFSGNNSGECILVARFATVADAEAYLAELMPGWVPDATYSAQWQQLFREQGVAGALELRETAYDEGRVAPRELVAIERVVVGAVYHASDAFPELRALAWQRGAEVMPGGIHVHDHFTVLAAVRARDDADRTTLAAAVPLPGARTRVHGRVVLVTAPLLGKAVVESLAALRDALRAYGGGRPLALEFLVDGELDDARWTRARKRLGGPLPCLPRLAVRFWSATPDDRAHAFARRMAAEAPTVAGDCVLFEHRKRFQRLAVLGLRAGGVVTRLEGETVRVVGTFRHAGPVRGRARSWPPADDAALAAGLRLRLPPGTACAIEPPRHWPDARCVTVESAAPAAVLTAFAAQATELGCELGVHVVELEPLDFALRRLLAAVGG